MNQRTKSTTMERHRRIQLNRHAYLWKGDFATTSWCARVVIYNALASLVPSSNNPYNTTTGQGRERVQKRGARKVEDRLTSATQTPNEGPTPRTTETGATAEERAMVEELQTTRAGKWSLEGGTTRAGAVVETREDRPTMLAGGEEGKGEDDSECPKEKSVNVEIASDLSSPGTLTVD